MGSDIGQADMNKYQKANCLSAYNICVLYTCEKYQSEDRAGIVIARRLGILDKKSEKSFIFFTPGYQWYDFGHNKPGRTGTVDILIYLLGYGVYFRELNGISDGYNTWPTTGKK